MTNRRTKLGLEEYEAYASSGSVSVLQTEGPGPPRFLLTFSTSGVDTINAAIVQVSTGKRGTGERVEELTPEQLRERMRELRDCATEARRLAQSLGPYLDSAFDSATQQPAIWLGPFAEQATQQLSGWQSTLHEMGRSLMEDASRWESEADSMELEAGSRGGEDGGNGGN